MTDDGQVRTAGTLAVAEHLRPKPPRFLRHLDCCQRYVRLARPGEICWRVGWVDLDYVHEKIIEGEA